MSPLGALKKGKGSSMWESIHSQISLNADVTLSAGNTGVLLVMSKMILKTLENVEIIIVDDRSTDNTKDIIMDCQILYIKLRNII